MSNPIKESIKDFIIPILVVIAILSVSVINVRHPVIERQIFELLIQVIVTVLGFSMVGMLYYLAKLDDKKKEYAHNWFKFVDIRSTLTMKENESVDKILEILSKSRIGKTPTFGDDLQKILKNKKEGLDRLDALKSVSKEVVNLFGLGDKVVKDIRLIIIYMTVCIMVCFLALFMFSNGLIEYVWGMFLLVVSLMTTAMYYYYHEWKSMRELFDMINNQSIAFEYANRIYESSQSGSHEIRSD